MASRVEIFINKHHGKKITHARLSGFLEEFLKEGDEKSNREKGRAIRVEKLRCASLAKYHIKTAEPNSTQSTVARQIFEDIVQNRIPPDKNCT